MNLKNLKCQLFLVPNIVTYLRVLLCPVVFYLSIAKSTYLFKSVEFPDGFPFLALIALIITSGTDVLDGFLARKLKQTSDWGKMIDPVADKIMHSVAALGLVVGGHLHWAFFVAILGKEFFMVAWGVFLMKNAKLIQANIMGKIASAWLSGGAFFCYFHTFFAAKVFYLDWIIMGLGVLLSYVAFSNYCYQGGKIVIQLLKEKHGKKNSTPQQVDDSITTDTTSTTNKEDL
ncbi:MAG: CDP-alcohol phosphatidyltransferase family protein [Christensenellaceae bacterium]|jgi:CDP-diacylglycerol--glycerol-3-phosphate 3-phosphatidyltransferase|nr:CDP-alcohol phosphatidyltransferase family protein [Christensenellaceae bacterium]